MDWKEIFKEGVELVLATYSEESGPHTIVMMSEGFIGEKLLINACQTQTTLSNLKKDNRVSVVAMNSGKYLRLKGTADLHDKGEYFEIAKKRNKGTKFEVKCAIIIEVKEVFDLDKVEVIIES
ncbi:MAG: pyridoxamine 5'-phosphate oxidase family protein [Parcubacteria group bacterium]|jgi:uncharacterized pyridoxamine 5'-phosphate oxidase family protein